MIARTEVVVQIPEDQLLARCRAGDVDAFGQIYAQHKQAVYRHAYHMLGHEEDACDVRQETFVRAYRSLPAFRGDCSLKTWLLTICTNLCRNRLRSRLRHVEVGCDPDVLAALYEQATMGDPVARGNRDRLLATVYAALDSLPIEARELIVLRDIENLSYKEISRILGCTGAYASVKLFRARNLLRSRLESLLREGE